jgi:hypothetical protein
MAPIVPSADMLTQLRGLTKSVEIADESGNVIGSFVPNDAYDRIMSYLLRPLSRDEVAEARAEMLAKGGATTAEILAAIDDAKRRWEAMQ